MALNRFLFCDFFQMVTLVLKKEYSITTIFFGDLRHFFDFTREAQPSKENMRMKVH
jgi:hypothetical protein